ncbi:MAG: DNA repair protein RecO [Sphingobacteriales bacterium]|nr:DNA repair protein RecO [Sphingobacteriales bacterium]
MSQLHTTKAIILRTVKYGETSLVVSAYTELFGIQSYLVNGVRTSSKKGAGKANLFQPGSILELIVYHNELKNLQRIKEFKWSYLYQHVLSDVIKNSIVLFMVELIQKCIKQPETNADLFNFIEESLIQVDKSNLEQLLLNYEIRRSLLNNLQLFYALHIQEFGQLKSLLVLQEVLS